MVLNTIIVPWTETIYYKRQQNGYHGGATPQEMICPLIILSDTNLGDERKPYPGLHPCEYLTPEWWSSAPAATVVVEEPAPAVVPRRTGPPSLFDKLRDEDPIPKEPTKALEPVRGVTTTASRWIERLLASQAYKDQKDSVRRHAPEDELVRRCLAALDAQGGMMTPAAFSKAADVAAGRLDGLIAQIQRLLNVDGYEILNFSRSENRIELNVPKLKRQFDLD